MIKYKRIYPLKQNGRLAAIVTVIGDNSSSEIFVKFKITPKETGLMLILFNPKTYEYEMLPLEDRMTIHRCLTDMTACIIACKNGMFIEFLMEGSINKTHLSTSKLKSIIAMDMYTCSDDIKEESSCDNMDNTNKEDLLKNVAEGRGEISSNECKDDETITFDSEENKELMDYLRQMEEGRLPLSYAPKEAEAPDYAKEEPGAADNSCDGVSSYNIHVPDTGKINIPKITDEASGKYCEFVNPFKERWNGVWWKVQYPDKAWHYIVGRVQVDGSNVSVLGVPGERNQKPVCLESCDMYAVSDNGVGYWLMFQK